MALSTVTGGNLSGGGQIRITQPTMWDTSTIPQPAPIPAPPPPAASAPPPPAPTTTPPPPAGLSDNLSGLTYGPEVYQNLPALKFAQGDISQAQYSQLGAQRQNIPALGVDLQAPNQQNWAKLNYLYKNSPGAFALLSSLYKAGNRDLLSEMASLGEYAPTGQAFVPSLISTV